MVAGAAGDALGAPYEFGPPVDHVEPMIGGGPFDWEPGEWTDDTQMAICIAEVAARGSLDPVAVADRFVGWGDEAADVGVQTRRVLSTARTGAELPDAAAAYYQQHADNSPNVSPTSPTTFDSSPTRKQPSGWQVGGDPNAASESVSLCAGLRVEVVADLPSAPVGFAVFESGELLLEPRAVLSTPTQQPLGRPISRGAMDTLGEHQVGDEVEHPEHLELKELIESSALDWRGSSPSRWQQPHREQSSAL
jgi:hypothetical protein